ncbi:MAG: 4Fe-4S dicluster domain-containing protein [Anaerolineae bacterium]
MPFSRRDFLKLSTAGVGGLLLIGAPHEQASAMPTQKAMLYDASKCIGCRACQVACKRWNKLPQVSTDSEGLYETPRDLSADTWTIIKLREIGPDDPGDFPFCKYQCMHCTQASCVSVCPTGAAAHRGEYVVIDQKWCIGCGYCVAACPFNVPHLGEPKGTARKCTFCFDRVTGGQSPACVEACPAEALLFGERAGLIARAEERVRTLKNNGNPDAHLYGVSELGGLGVIYVLPRPTSLYGLPPSPKVATSNVLFQWLSGLIAAGTVVAFPFWLLFRRKEELTAEKSSEGGEKR